MKKLLILLVAIACAFSLFACGAEHEHELSDGWLNDATAHWQTCNGCDVKQNQGSHTFGAPVTVKEPTAEAEGEEKVTCTVCGYEKVTPLAKLDHTHNYSSDWTSDAKSHWHACDGCSVKKDEAEHTWDKGEVTKEPSSTATGERKYTCTVCDKTKTEPIDALPAKMTADKWIAAFAFENVRVDNESTYEMFGMSETTTGYYLIDGDLVYTNSEDYGEAYDTRDSIMVEIDFSLYYDLFDHTGDNVYYADSLTLTASDEGVEVELALTDVTIAFTEDVITSISYSYDMYGMMTGTESYTFSQYGEVTVELPTITAEQLAAALDEDNFANYTLSSSIYVSDTDYTSAYYYIDGNKYLCETYNSDDTTDTTDGELENAGVALIDDVLTILSQVEAEDFAFDSYYGCFAATVSIEYADGNATLSIVEVYIALDEDGKLAYCGYVTEDGTAYDYNMYDYGITEISTEE